MMVGHVRASCAPICRHPIFYTLTHFAVTPGVIARYLTGIFVKPSVYAHLLEFGSLSGHTD